jgi:hypothetical protein
MSTSRFTPAVISGGQSYADMVEMDQRCADGIEAAVLAPRQWRRRRCGV